MSPAGLPRTFASQNGRVKSLARQCCPVEGNILIKIVEIGTTGIALEGLRWSPIGEYDTVVFELDMQVFKDICLHRAQPGDAAAVDQITRRYQKTIYEKAVPTGHVKIAVRQIAVERAARDSDRSDFIVP